MPAPSSGPASRRAGLCGVPEALPCAGETGPAPCGHCNPTCTPCPGEPGERGCGTGSQAGLPRTWSWGLEAATLRQSRLSLPPRVEGRPQLAGLAQPLGHGGSVMCLAGRHRRAAASMRTPVPLPGAPSRRHSPCPRCPWAPVIVTVIDGHGARGQTEAEGRPPAQGSCSEVEVAHGRAAQNGGGLSRAGLLCRQSNHVTSSVSLPRSWRLLTPGPWPVLVHLCGTAQSSAGGLAPVLSCHVRLLPAVIPWQTRRFPSHVTSSHLPEAGPLAVHSQCPWHPAQRSEGKDSLVSTGHKATGTPLSC